MEEAMSPTPAAVAILGCLAGTWKADPVRTGIGLSARPLMAGKGRGPARPAPHRTGTGAAAQDTRRMTGGNAMAEHMPGDPGAGDRLARLDDGDMHVAE